MWTCRAELATYLECKSGKGDAVFFMLTDCAFEVARIRFPSISLAVCCHWSAIGPSSIDLLAESGRFAHFAFPFQGTTRC